MTQKLDSRTIKTNMKSLSRFNPVLLLYGVAAYLIWDMLLRKKTLADTYTDKIIIPKGQSYPDYRYQEFADVIFNAMDTIEGTDEDAIIRTLRLMKTNADIKKLKETFGNPVYTGQVLGFGSWFNNPTTLSGWLSLEGMLERSNGVLASKGITERF